MKKFLPVIFCLFSATLYGQQLDRIGKKGGFKISGGVGLANNFYVADGISNRLNPYSYLLSGNVNLSIYGFSLPFSFSFSNQNFAYRQPFNIYGLSPTYKNLTLHMGYRNLTFSPYTLNGHNFFGGGVEYRGKVLSFTAMSGRFLRPIEYDSNNTNALPTYRRLGGGGKVTYRSGSDELTLIGFYAKDQMNSIRAVPKEIGLTPQENMVWSIGGKKMVFEKLMLQAEIARSAWTKDLTSESASKNSTNGSGIFFIPWKQSTLVYGAIRANATYNFKFMTLGAGYERVDPEYRTLGAYYFNNDLENVTLNFSTTFFKKKVSLSANGGLQRDDLKNTKASAMKRKVGSVNLGLNPGKRLNLNFSYSNFYSFTNIKPVDVKFIQGSTFSQIDTLNFVQLSQTASGSVNYKILESDYMSRMISANSSWMATSNKQGSSNQVNQMLNASLMYNQLWKKSGINFSVNTNANQSQYIKGNSIFAGLGINTSAAMFKKKVRVSLGVNVNENFEKGNLVARLYAVNNSYSLKIHKHHSFNIGLRYSGRAKIKEAELGRYNSSFNEFFGSAGYNYTF